MEDKRTREEIMGITADRFENHSEYYLQLAKALGVGWPDPENTKFMGRTLDQWRNLYAGDASLNNAPIKEFDAHFAFDHLMVTSKFGPVGWSMCDSVCVRKNVIREAVLNSYK
jgi:hypothetical protein